MSANNYPGLRADGRAGLGRAFDLSLDKMDRGLLKNDSTAAAGLRQSSEALLRAQLTSGQHVLNFGQAMIIASAIGLAALLVRPGIGDPSAFKLREAR